MKETMIFSKNISNTKELPITLVGMGLNHPQERIIRPTGVPFYQWIQCITGRGMLFIGDISYLLEPGWGIFLPPDISHEYWGVTENWTVNFLCFSGDFSSHLMNQFNLKEAGVYFVPSPERIIELENKIASIYYSDLGFKDEKISGCLYEIILSLSSLAKNPSLTHSFSQNLRLKRIIGYIEENYNKDISLDEISEFAGISKEYLCAMFKKNMGQTVVSFITESRLVRSKIFLMQFPEKKIYEIAKMSGFEDSSYFCLIFKKSTGNSPKEFRMLNLSNN